MTSTKSLHYNTFWIQLQDIITAITSIRFVALASILFELYRNTNVQAYEQMKPYHCTLVTIELDKYVTYTASQKLATDSSSEQSRHVTAYCSAVQIRAQHS